MMEHPCPLYIQKLSLLTEALSGVFLLSPKYILTFGEESNQIDPVPGSSHQLHDCEAGVLTAPDEQHRVLLANGAIDAAHEGVDVFVHPVFVVGVDALGEPLADRFQRSVAIAHGTLLSRARGLLNALPDAAPLRLCGPPATQLDHRMSSTR
jgi:hypothetical protein